MYNNLYKTCSFKNKTMWGELGAWEETVVQRNHSVKLRKVHAEIHSDSQTLSKSYNKIRLKVSSKNANNN